MNIMLRIAAVSLSALLLSACAGTQEMTRSDAPAAEPQARPELTRDELYIAYVERVARRRGIHVMWVNPPQKRLAGTE
ncbi:hypothetical protein SAMN06296416_11185 [Pseudoxanthomonas wuyuanensis]|uniref:Uncharacterized protein n=1 Tax=Pseudoxanthomonas wuyuanensis TaxID=1073196 RepID=A0A286DE69_9GAMM|nr:hypothetical protein [Pseudoxanthomonas wuyuanensis]SOD56940.1 hypothetical protein SAMN06296416_11185 [Pseudoxanthomonas wuyuanensis]